MTQMPIRILSVAALLLLAVPGIADEPHFNNSLGMTMVRVEPGSFEMGSPEGETIIPSDRRDENPRHRVTISRPFYMAATEVTNAQYEQFNPDHKRLRGKLGFSKADDEAVVFVSWNHAVAFCQWLSQKEGKPYRLPIEAEWEYACRAGTTTPYHTGQSLPESFHKNVGTIWFPTRKSDKDVVPLHVAETPANPWGLP